MLDLHQSDTSVEFVCDGFRVEMLPYEHDFLHAVAVGFVPIFANDRFGFHEPLEFIGRHRGVPLSGFAD